MQPRCRACSHPERGAIDAALAKGRSIKSLARQYSLSLDTLYRHRARGHIPEQVFAKLKANALRPEIDLEKLRIEESDGLLLNLQRQRAVLLAAQDKAVETDQLGIVAQLGAQIHSNLRLVGQYLGEFAQHQTKIVTNLVLQPEYLELRAKLTEALRQYPEARAAAAAALRSIESRPPVIEGEARAEQ